MTLCEASTSELDMVLQNFFAELKKKDGTDYKSESLRTMLAALDKFFRNSGCKYGTLLYLTPLHSFQADKEVW